VSRTPRVGGLDDPIWSDSGEELDTRVLNRSVDSTIQVSFSPLLKQNRWTVLLRLFLAVPQLIASLLLTVPMGLVVIASWFIALFAGRVPRSLAQFTLGVIRWQTRVSAYVGLLTDRYPPFSLDDEVSYPIRVIAEPNRLNRAAVLFRIVLVIPVAIYAFLLSTGYVIFLPICWLTTLILGRMPQAFFGANSSVIRFEARLAGYWDLVSSEWPWGSFGDGLDVAAPVATETPNPSSEMTDLPSIEDTESQPGWVLRLSGSARWLLALFLALGVTYEGLVQAGVVPLQHNGYGYGIRFSFRTGSSAVDFTDAAQLATDYRSLSTKFNDLTQQGNTKCHSLTCVEELGSQQGELFRNFGLELSSLNVESSYSAAATAIEGDASLLATVYGVLYKSSSAKSFESYSAAHSSEIISTTNRFNDQVRALVRDLQAS
jgi:hypothetical protein